MQPHNRTRPFTLRHICQVNPDQFGGSAANINNQQLIGLSADQRRTGNHCKPRFFLWLDNFKRQSGFAPDLRHKVLTIAGTTTGFCRDKAHVFHAMPVQLLAANTDCIDRPVHRRTRQFPSTL